MEKGEVKPKLFAVIYIESTNWGSEEAARWVFKDLKSAHKKAVKESKYIKEIAKESDDYAALRIVDVASGKVLEEWTANLGEFNHSKGNRFVSRKTMH